MFLGWRVGAEKLQRRGIEIKINLVCDTENKRKDKRNMDEYNENERYSITRKWDVSLEK
jgi:hypothetical protein